MNGHPVKFPTFKQWVKHFAIPLAMTISMVCHAENQNPFVPPLPQPHAAGPVFPPPPLDEPSPQNFTENRSVFDTLEVIGRGAKFAILRYPMSGGAAGATTSTQGVSYRELIIRSERNASIGGRSFKVVLPIDGTNVLLVDNKSGKVLWDGDLSAPKVYYATPNVADYQYTPPVAAGTGVGQSGAAGQSAAAGQAAMPAGMIR